MYYPICDAIRSALRDGISDFYHSDEGQQVKRSIANAMDRIVDTVYFEVRASVYRDMGY